MTEKFSWTRVVVRVLVFLIILFGLRYFFGRETR
jgi:phage shock protein PspC (stress-responsive transcriptional regulator)